MVRAASARAAVKSVKAMAPCLAGRQADREAFATRAAENLNCGLRLTPLPRSVAIVAVRGGIGMNTLVDNGHSRSSVGPDQPQTAGKGTPQHYAPAHARTHPSPGG